MYLSTKIMPKPPEKCGIAAKRANTRADSIEKRTCRNKSFLKSIARHDRLILESAPIPQHITEIGPVVFSRQQFNIEKGTIEAVFPAPIKDLLFSINGIIGRRTEAKNRSVLAPVLCDMSECAKSIVDHKWFLESEIELLRCKTEIPNGLFMLSI